MLKTILLIVAAAIAALLIYAATKPDSFRLSRSATIAAPPDKVFALINDLRQFTFSAPGISLVPAVVILIASVAFNVFGDGLRGLLDVKGDGR